MSIDARAWVWTLRVGFGPHTSIWLRKSASDAVATAISFGEMVCSSGSSTWEKSKILPSRFLEQLAPGPRPPADLQEISRGYKAEPICCPCPFPGEVSRVRSCPRSAAHPQTPAAANRSSGAGEAHRRRKTAHGGAERVHRCGRRLSLKLFVELLRHADVWRDSGRGVDRASDQKVHQVRAPKCFRRVRCSE